MVIDGIPSMLTSSPVFPSEETMFANAGGESFSGTAVSTAEQVRSEGTDQSQED